MVLAFSRRPPAASRSAAPTSEAPRETLARTNFTGRVCAVARQFDLVVEFAIFGLLYGIRSLRTRVEALLEQFGLAHLRHIECGLLSSVNRLARLSPRRC